MVSLNGNVGGDADSDVCSLLLKCVADKRIDVLRSILAEISKKPDFHQQLDKICCDDGTVLHFAVLCSSVDSVRTLLAAGANPCVENQNGQTPYQATKVVEIRNAFVQELLHAVAQSNLGRVCQMISSGVSVDSTDSPASQNTALHWATSYGDDNVVRVLCESGASVNLVNSNGETALMEAVQRDDASILRCLLAHGADPSIKNANGEDCFDLAAKLGGNMLQNLSINLVSKAIHRSTSVDSDLDRSSIISGETTTLFAEQRVLSSANGRIENWTDLLWPQPKYISFNRGKLFPYPKDDRLKIYFDGASTGEPRRIMQIIQMSSQFLAGIHLELEYRGHKLQEHSSLDGRVMCGIFENDCCSGSYTLTITENGVELYGEDYAGIRNGFSTLVQILRIHKDSVEEKTAATNGPSLSTLYEEKPSPQSNSEVGVPCLTVRDSPDMCFRAVFLDFSGCKILNSETLLQLATRIGYCKASHMFVNFEVRTTDRYQLPYTNRDLFHMTQVCDELFVKLVPSLDVQASSMESSTLRKVVESFLDDFPLTKVVHFGQNIASILITKHVILDSIQRRVPRIFLTVEIDEKNASLVNDLPPYVTLCVEGRYPFNAQKLLSPRINIILRFSTSDPGYLCAAPESVTKRAIFVSKLGDGFPILGSMICDLSTGCEMMPPSLSCMAIIASIGVSWNKSVDMKRFSSLLPRITAEHVLLDGNMEVLFKQALTVGRVEHVITRFSCGMHYPNDSADLDVSTLGKKIPISVFVEMILNPDNMVFERLTPVIFKKARIELKRSLQALDHARKNLPYNYELALVLAEIQIVTELMILACKLGQSLCMHGANPSSPSYQSKHSTASNDEKSIQHPLLGYQIVNVGVANLPLTIRTDLANSLLRIRTQFQHTWLSRNIASTLSNALKIFDNLFRALLPPNLQDYGKNLL